MYVVYTSHTYRHALRALLCDAENHPLFLLVIIDVLADRFLSMGRGGNP